MLPLECQSQDRARGRGHFQGENSRKVVKYIVYDIKIFNPYNILGEPLL